MANGTLFAFMINAQIAWVFYVNLSLKMLLIKFFLDILKNQSTCETEVTTNAKTLI